MEKQREQRKGKTSNLLLPCLNNTFYMSTYSVSQTTALSFMVGNMKVNYPLKLLPVKKTSGLNFKVCNGCIMEEEYMEGTPQNCQFSFLSSPLPYLGSKQLQGLKPLSLRKVPANYVFISISLYSTFTKTEVIACI